MSKIKTCSRCLYDETHPLKIIINDDSICSGCKIHEEKNTLDWESRWNDLEKLVKPYKSINGNNYDCIVPVTGANDSYYILHIVKEKLGLNPLIVTYNKYYNTSLGIRNLANLRIKFDCDILIQNISPISVKRITRASLREFGSIYWHCLAGQSVFPVQTAVRYKIPLIIWGAHQGVEQVGMFSHLNNVEMTRRYRKDHDLMGFEADDILSYFDNLGEEDIWQYRYPEDSKIRDIGIKGIYLGNYVRWDPRAQHEQMIEMYDYKTSNFSRSFDNYDHVDCFNYLNLHDKLKFYKHGYSKVLDHASREIRFGRLSRAQAKNLVKWHQAQPINYLDYFCEWLGVNKKSLQFIIDQHRNPLFWSQDEPGRWNYKESRSEFKNIKSINNMEYISTYINNSELECDKIKGYITVGKGVY
jgi:N-acetyl sugar amidotransferase